MEERKKNDNPIDAGAASMAYMPGANGKSDAQDSESELSIDVSAEKQTMADIASDLEPDDKSSAIKVPIGGKPVAVAATKAEAKVAPKPAKAPVKPTKADLDDMPLEIHDNTAPNEFEQELDDDMPESNTDSAHHGAAKPARGGKKALAIVLGISLIGTAVLGWLWWSQQATVASLNDKVASLQSSEKTLKSELADASASTSSSTESTPTPVAAGTVRSIPEVALTYKLTDTTKKVTYSYSEVTADSTVHSVLRFSSTDLIGAERKVVTDPAKYLCNSDSAPLGKLTSYKATDTVPEGGKASALKADNKTIFKLGETYFIYTSSQSTCSADKTVQASQTAGKVLVTELLSTLAR